MPWTVVLEKTLEGPLDNKEIKPVNPKGNQSRIFVWRTDAEAEAPILWPPDGKCWLIGKAPDAGGDWGHEEKGATEVEMIGWYHWLNRQESEQILGDSEGQGSLDAAVHSVAKSWTWLSYWTAITLIWACRFLTPTAVSWKLFYHKLGAEPPLLSIYFKWKICCVLSFFST